MVREMTRGNPLKLILGFCLPMLLGNIFQQLYSMVDTVIVGKCINLDALAAVGSTGSVSFLVIGFTTGITSGSCILPAQLFGAGDYSQMRRAVAHAVYLCVITTVTVTALAVSLCYPLLKLMQTPDDVIGLAYDYIVVIFMGIGVTMAYNLMAGILRAMGDSKTPLYFLILASLINIGLDFLFIMAFNMGVAGAGWATVVSQGISAVLCFIYIRRSYPILRYEKEELKFSGKILGSIAKIGVAMGLQFSITAVGSIILQGAVNGLGKVTMAAITAANKMQSLVIAPMETLGITMATYAGQNLGAGNYRRITQGMHRAYCVGMIYAVVAMVLVWVFSGSLCMLFINENEENSAQVIEQAVHFIRINGLFYLTLAYLFIVRNMLQGVGYSFLPMLAGAAELMARTAVALGFVRRFGFEAVCFASPIAWIAADLLLMTVYIVKMREIKRRTDENGMIVRPANS
ncbi:MAG: MATE family efflux transporter [Firmicutes bacterium]|nr:MATE family efflux transporter [[Eubacterium] siraeum]MCM1486884.1 MATE family efflux transporter [Bacillota bacterium]